MKLFRASLKIIGISSLIYVGTASAQIFTNTSKWFAWTQTAVANKTNYYSAYINFSATVNPYETWTSPDNGSTLKGTVFQLLPGGALQCYVIETRPAGGSLDTKIWTYPNGSGQPIAVADDPDGQYFAKFVMWGGANTQFIVTTYSSSGSNGNFQLFASARTDITSELDCRNAKPTWSYLGGISRYF